MKPSIRVVIVVAFAVAILGGTSLDVPWSYWASRPFADPPPKVDVYEAVLRISWTPTTPVRSTSE